MSIDRRRFIRDSSLVLSAGALGLGACSEQERESATAAAPKVELLASYWTLAGDVDPTGAVGPDFSPFTFRERVEAIAKVGFTGMGIW
ncbi:MAG TPA: hypothetical protein VGA18_09505, partial [Rhodothermales bacterium]